MKHNSNWFCLIFDIISLKEDLTMALQTATPVPDFTLPSQLGTNITLSSYRGRNVVLAFFPLAWTPI